jgi:hypothetical protein
METIIFKESQKFTQIWLWLIVFGIVAIFVWGIIQQIFFEIPFGNHPVSDQALWFYGLIPLTIILLFFSLRLQTLVKRDGIYVRFSPFVIKYKRIKIGEIKSYEIRKYKPIKEYGGWGIKFGGRKVGKAYNVKGNIGMQLEFTNGKKLLIGTQKPDEFLRAVEKIK